MRFLADGHVLSAVPWENYQLSEFPWPLQLRRAYSTAIFPPAKAILEYIEASLLLEAPSSLDCLPERPSPR